ncbi:LamG domain-containing protein [Candidatus Woesearchaeota archaeon]|nr:LamG domain-containing protein [Candidatus Woesearchaeota archaeon]
MSSTTIGTWKGVILLLLIGFIALLYQSDAILLGHATPQVEQVEPQNFTSNTTLNASPCIGNLSCGLVSHWSGDNDSKDSTGNNHGSLISAGYGPGIIGSAFALNGVNAYVDIPPAPTLGPGTNGFSYGLWINPASHKLQYIFSNFKGRGEGYLIRMLQSGVVQALNGNADCTNNDGSSSTTVPPINNWSHIFVTHTPGTQGTRVLYINGKAAATDQTTYCASNEHIRFGFPTNDAWQHYTVSTGGKYEWHYFHGSLDDIRFYNRQLTPEEVATLYRFGPAARCEFNKGNYSFASQQCCSPLDQQICGTRIGDEVCMNPGGRFVWQNITQSRGDIFDIPCADMQILTNGSDTRSCGNTARLSTNHTPFSLINLSITGVDQYTTHSYLCAQADIANNNSRTAIIECIGDGRSYDRQQGRAAQIGDARQLGELFFAELGRDDVITTGAKGNFEGNSGQVKITINNSWAGSEDLTRIIFLAEEDIDTYLSIEKSKNSLSCNAVNANVSSRLTFDISNLSPALTTGQTHAIIMAWNASGYMRCSLDSILKTRTGYTPVNARELFINTGPRGAQGSQSALRIHIGSQLDAPTVYCSKDAQWTADLDSKDSITCRVAGHTWTGSRCCSEAEDLPNESYNDPDDPAYNQEENGACFASQHAPNGLVVPNTNGSVLTILGQLYGCQLNETAPHMASLTDTHTGRTLINNTNHCTLAYNATRDVNVNYYCAHNGTWTRTPKQDRLFEKNLPTVITPNATIHPQGCCAASECFTGTRCQTDQTNDSTITSTFSGMRCLNGNWTTATPKESIDGLSLGFCPRNDQCLVNPRGNRSNNNKPETYSILKPDQQPICISSGQNIRELYCDGGNWSSRMMLLARHLIRIADQTTPQEYAILCDRIGETIPDISAELETYFTRGCPTIAREEVPCVNQVCILKNPQWTIMAASLNVPINDTAKSYLAVIGKPINLCDHVLRANISGFAPCSQGIFYDPTTNSILSTQSGQQTPQTIPQAETFIRDRLKDMTLFAGRPSLANFQSFLAVIGSPDGVYISRKGSQEHFAYIGTDILNRTPIDYIVLRYADPQLANTTTTDVCYLLSNSIRTDLAKDCQEQQGVTRFIAVSSSESSTFRTFWRDLGAKFR